MWNSTVVNRQQGDSADTKAWIPSHRFTKNLGVGEA
jgi:hypothetical protein